MIWAKLSIGSVSKQLPFKKFWYFQSIAKFGKESIRSLVWNSLVIITSWVHRGIVNPIVNPACDNWYGWRDGYQQGSINLITSDKF